MTILLEMLDPWGRTLVLSNSQWNDHIALSHPEVVPLLDTISDTIMMPDLVTFDALHPARENFYRADVRGRLLLKVCVHFTAHPDVSPATGIIVTAYLTGRVKPKERVKWSSTA